MYTSQSNFFDKGRQMRGEKELIVSCRHDRTALSLADRVALKTRLYSFWYRGRSCVRANLPKSSVCEKESRPISFSNS